VCVCVCVCVVVCVLVCLCLWVVCWCVCRGGPLPSSGPTVLFMADVRFPFSSASPSLPWLRVQRTKFPPSSRMVDIPTFSCCSSAIVLPCLFAIQRSPHWRSTLFQVCARSSSYFYYSTISAPIFSRPLAVASSSDVRTTSSTLSSSFVLLSVVCMPSLFPPSPRFGPGPFLSSRPHGLGREPSLCHYSSLSLSQLHLVGVGVLPAPPHSAETFFEVFRF
jgi:hypothetical protein